MLELLFDNRSGSRPEIVVPVFNEHVRIRNLIDYYANFFDLVFLDGGSTDDTLEVAAAANATAFHRCGPEGVGENHFVYYANEVSASGRSFYLFADELAERDELGRSMALLGSTDSAVFGRRLDWFYGTRSAVALPASLRGVKRGQAVYDPARLHDSLTLQHPVTVRREIVVHHFQLWSMAKYFGQAGAYAHTETQQHLQSSTPVRRFLRRFVLSEIGMLPRHLWRMRAAPLALLAWRVVMSIAVASLGALSWLELKYLKSPAQQLDFYRKMYESTADHESS